MSLGPHLAEWQALRTELRALAEDCAALDAFVVDRFGVLWCSAHGATPEIETEAIALARRAVAFHSGDDGALDRNLPAGGRRAHVRSFAIAFVVVVIYDELARDVRAGIARHLAQLEPLAMALVPHGTAP